METCDSMGRGRMREQCKLMQKAYNYSVRKKKWEKTFPIFDNFNLDYSLKNHFDKIILHVIDLLDVKDNIKHTTIMYVEEQAKKPLIICIACPYCGDVIVLNSFWNGYFCENPQHGKKIFEIVKAEVEKEEETKEEIEEKKEDFFVV